jgi:hypothetical protein
MLHLSAAVACDRHLLGRFAAAIQKRHAELSTTTGLNQEVFDSLVIVAAGSLDLDAIQRGFRAVRRLEQLMHKGRVRRLQLLGFNPPEASRLSELHTKNFM